jgi:hypothetical protein
MAITVGLGPGRDARIGAIASATSPGKQNVPPFRGSTWNYSMPKAISVNRSENHETRKAPVSRKERIAMFS